MPDETNVFFQAGMAVTGWAAGIFLSPFIASFDHWVAFLILSIIGIHMIHEGIPSQYKMARPA
jgi:putative Mn2+ efflux pump MntP